MTSKKKIFLFGEKKLDLSTPVVMGILNLTPDSFYDGGHFQTETEQMLQAEKMISEGASILDIGAVSTRPGTEPVDEKEELRRLTPALRAVIRNFPDCLISVDTFRTSVARTALDYGADMINDIYAGRFDGKMIGLVTSRNVPYSMMHMQGTPGTMQENPAYGDVVSEILEFFRERLEHFPEKYPKIFLDPGFGFGKTVEHNFTLLGRLSEFRKLGYPVLAGLSRKSMINQVLRTYPHQALNGTTVLNTIALLNGADVLRVHDVKQAMEAIQLVAHLR
ncbi:MAG TPA: dihydropteroate synthase [Bacteroidales bacterium]|nr:dihydropteroate synthase [Bacteroidales bacterium]